jgi:hypothetical protein
MRFCLPKKYLSWSTILLKMDVQFTGMTPVHDIDLRFAGHTAARRKDSQIVSKHPAVHRSQYINLTHEVIMPWITVNIIPKIMTSMLKI